MALTNNLITNSLIAHYPMTIKGGKVIDISGNNFHGTPYNVGSVKGKWGSCIDFSKSNSYIDCGANDFLGVGPLTISAMIYPRTFGGSNFGRILDNGRFIYATTSSSSKLNWSDDTLSAASANNSIYLNQWHHVIMTRTSSGLLNFYINGILSGTANQQGSAIAGTKNLTIGNIATALNRAFDGLIDSLKIWNRVLSASEIKKEFNSYAKQINMRECLCYEDVSTNVITPKGWIKGTGSYYVSTSTNSFFKKPTKVLTCSVAGTIAIPSKQSYGEWSFAFCKNASSYPNILFISNNISYGGSENAYLFRSVEDETCYLISHSSGAPAIRLRTSSSYITANIWYKIKITRSLSGQFTLLIKGGNFIATPGYNGYTLVSTSGGSGSNPVTENTFISSTYFVLDLDAGDQFADLTLNESIVQL